MKIRIDSYEAGSGAIGGLATVHNNLYPQLVTRGFDVKTFAMMWRKDLPIREVFKGVVIRRSPVDIDFDTAYAWTYDILHQYGIDVEYLQREIASLQDWSKRYFTNFAAIPIPYRMSTIDLYAPHDWMSYLRSALHTWLHPDLPQTIFLHSTEPGRTGGVWHNNPEGTSESLRLDEFKLAVKNDFHGSFYNGSRLIRDMEFSLTYRILRRQTASALYTVSRLHRKEYLLGLRAHGARFGLIEDRVFPIYHGVDVHDYRPLPGAEKDEFTVGFIGRCSYVKGIDVIPYLASILKDKIPGIKFHVVTKTDPSNRFFTLLHRLIDEYRVRDRVTLDNTFYIGEDKTALINTWDLLLCPSRYEPQGQVDLEAMACGVVPAVGLGGLREKVVDGFDGIWILPDDPEATAERILALYQGRYQGRGVAELARNARESAEKIWDWEKRAEAHREVYNYMVDGRVDEIAPDLGELLLPKVDAAGS